MTPNVVVASLQIVTFGVTLTYFLPRLYLVATRFRHNRDGLLVARFQQLLKSFALLLIAGWGAVNRIDMILHPEIEDRWLGLPGDRWEDVIVWGLMLAAVVVYSWLYWRVERRIEHDYQKKGTTAKV